MRSDLARWMSGAALVCAASVSSAHHSYASFDMNRSQTMSGTVSQWEWTNPHSFLHLSVSAQDGPGSDWVFESSSPALLARHGFTRNTFHSGDRLTIAYHPSRSAPNSGSLESVTFADGRILSVQTLAVPDPAVKP